MLGFVAFHMVCWCRLYALAHENMNQWHSKVDKFSAFLSKAFDPLRIPSRTTDQ